MSKVSKYLNTKKGVKFARTAEREKYYSSYLNPDFMKTGEIITPTHHIPSARKNI